MKLNILFYLIFLASFSSCSVMMAAKQEGVDLHRIQECQTRGQILSCSPIVVSSEKNGEGELIEVYQFTKPKGSSARAFMHGVLDVGTGGLWEVIGTPMEACLDQKECYALRVVYNDREFIERIELL